MFGEGARRGAFAVLGNGMLVLAALIAVTAVWGVTFVQVKDAVALYPLFAFLAVRFAIATLTLAVPGTRRVRSLGARVSWRARCLACSSPPAMRCRRPGSNGRPCPAPASSRGCTSS